METFENAIKNIISYKYNNNTGKIIHLGYAIDDNYVRCTATSIASFCLNNKEYNFNVHIIGNKLSNLNKERFNKLAKVYDINIYIYEMNVNLLKDEVVKEYLDIPSYIRLTLPLVLKNVDRLYYIDSDVICLKNAKNFFETDLEGNAIAAVADSKIMNKNRNKILNLKNHIYFNAGILIIDLVQWNKINTFEKFMQITEKNPRKFDYWDQDTLNILFDKKVKYLSRIYNYIELNNLDSSEIVNNEDVVLLHFAANPKPWHLGWNISSVCNSFNKNIYKFYEECTPWKDIPLETPYNAKMVRSYIKSLLYNGNYLKLIPWVIKYFRLK